MAGPISIYCADVGSVAAGNFAWFGESAGSPAVRGTTMPGLADAVAADLRADRRVALGFECPLFVPLRERPDHLTMGRVGEGNRSWSAGAGCGALTTGLVQVVWLLREIRRLVRKPSEAFLDWPRFVGARSGLFLWEALVIGGAKGGGHVADAAAAVKAFARATASLTLASAVTTDGECYSLVGAALLRSGWSADLALLGRPCAVVRAGASSGVETP